MVHIIEQQAFLLKQIIFICICVRGVEETKSGRVRLTGMKWTCALFIELLHHRMVTQHQVLQITHCENPKMKEDIPGGNLRVFRPVSFVSQVAGKGRGARWRVERRWCQGMSHVKWKIWKMSLLKCGKCEGGRISKAGGSQVTMCCYRYSPPLEVEGPLPMSWYG